MKALRALSVTLDEWIPAGDLRRLVIVRGLRSFVQGYVTVIFAIYLGLIGFPAWLIGLTLTIGGIASALLTLLTGVLSDRIGRRPFLLLYGWLLLIAGILFSLTTIPWVLIVISALGGLGRGGGSGGQAGPFMPAEQAIIAEKASGETRTRVFAANSVVGTGCAALGAVLAGVPEWAGAVWHLSILASYRAPTRPRPALPDGARARRLGKSPLPGSSMALAWASSSGWFRTGCMCAMASRPAQLARCWRPVRC